MAPNSLKFHSNWPLNCWPLNGTTNLAINYIQVNYIPLNLATELHEIQLNSMKSGHWMAPMSIRFRSTWPLNNIKLHSIWPLNCTRVHKSPLDLIIHYTKSHYIPLSLATKRNEIQLSSIKSGHWMAPNSIEFHSIWPLHGIHINWVQLHPADKWH